MNSIAFGTDGIRGPAGQHPLTAESMKLLGQAIALSLESSNSKVIIGRDSRQSGEWIEESLSFGLSTGGVEVLLGGVMPTAAVACAVVDEKAHLGIVITASHNPWTDNGVKFFSDTGKKVSDSFQKKLETNFGQSTIESAGKVRRLTDPLKAWRRRMPQPCVVPRQRPSA